MPRFNFGQIYTNLTAKKCYGKVKRKVSLIQDSHKTLDPEFFSFSLAAHIDFYGFPEVALVSGIIFNPYFRRRVRQNRTGGPIRGRTTAGRPHIIDPQGMVAYVFEAESMGYRLEVGQVAKVMFCGADPGDDAGRQVGLNLEGKHPKKKETKHTQ